MIRANKHAEADTFIMKNWLGRNQQCYQPLGDLHLEFTARRRGHRVPPLPRPADRHRRGELPPQRRHLHARGVRQPPRPGDRDPAARRPGRGAGLHRQLQLGAPHRQEPGGGRESSSCAGSCPASSPAAPCGPSRSGATSTSTPSCTTSAGKRLPHAEQVLYGKAIGGKGMFFEARLAIQTDGKVAAAGDGPAGPGRQRGAARDRRRQQLQRLPASPSRAGLDPCPAHDPGGAGGGEDATSPPCRSATSTTTGPCSIACRCAWTATRPRTSCPPTSASPRSACRAIPTWRRWSSSTGVIC